MLIFFQFLFYPTIVKVILQKSNFNHRLKDITASIVSLQNKYKKQILTELFT